jgi:hypothetical protein
MTQQDPDLSVRKSACDIWTTCCSQCEITDEKGGGSGATFSSVLIPLLKQYTPTLIATLLDGMIYSEIDLQQIQAELRDAAKLHGAPVAQGRLPGTTTMTMKAMETILTLKRIGRCAKRAQNPSTNSQKS